MHTANLSTLLVIRQTKSCTQKKMKKDSLGAYLYRSNVMCHTMRQSWVYSVLGYVTAYTYVIIATLVTKKINFNHETVISVRFLTISKVIKIHFLLKASIQKMYIIFTVSSASLPLSFFILSAVCHVRQITSPTRPIACKSKTVINLLYS